METKQNKIMFTCSRPTLATELIDAGYSAEQKTSPWDKQKTLWVFELDDKAVDIVRRHYVRVNRPMPKRIVDFLKSRTAKTDREIEVR